MDRTESDGLSDSSCSLCRGGRLGGGWSGYPTDDLARDVDVEPRWGATTGVLLGTGGMKGGHADKEFLQLALVGTSLLTLEVVKLSARTALLKAEISWSLRVPSLVSNKPHCNNRAITEDATALKLHHSGCVVQVDGDAGRDATDGIPVVLKCRRMSWSIYILGTATSAATTPGTRLSFTIVLDLSGERHWDQCCNR